MTYVKMAISILKVITGATNPVIVTLKDHTIRNVIQSLGTVTANFVLKDSTVKYVKMAITILKVVTGVNLVIVILQDPAVGHVIKRLEPATADSMLSANAVTCAKQAIQNSRFVGFLVEIDKHFYLAT